MIRSLLGKLLLSHLAVIVITTAGTGLLLSHLVTDYLIEAKQHELIREGTATVRFLEPTLGQRNLLPSLLANLGELSGTRLWIMDERGAVLSGQPPRRWRHRMQMPHHGAPSAELKELFEGSVKSWIYRQRGDDDPSIVVAVPFAGRPSLALFLHTPITGITSTSEAIERLLLYATLISVALAALIALFLSRSLTRPIRDIGAAAEKFAAGNYQSRTAADGQDEIGKLGRTFNAMADALLRIEQNRREFFSDVTHELKTPIAAIQALTESILDGLVDDAEKRRRYLRTILDETKHMNRLISDLLNLAQLESGRLQFCYESVSLAPFLAALQEKFQGMLAEKSQALTLLASPGLEALRSDAGRLEQILTNLIGNAIRHSPESSEIHVAFEAQERAVRICVRDRGEGIPADELPHIWERFYRVDKSRDRAKGGTGLGLAITKKLVEGMGGKIQVTSTPGEGTEFAFTLPQTP